VALPNLSPKPKVSRPSTRKPARNMYGDPLPPGGSKKLKYNHTKLYDIMKTGLKYNSEGKCVNAFKKLSNPGTLKLAYESIKSKSGNMVCGTDRETLDGITKDWFHKTHEQLTSHKFKFRSVRRVHIPKPDNSGTRPLGIGSPRDKIVQQSWRMVFEHVLNPKFLNCSYGFRPKRGCHQALEKVSTWTAVHWFIEGDIKKFFDNIDYKVLEGMIKKYFDDPELIRLYWSFVRAGYMEKQVNGKRYSFTKGTVGVPQGGIISPLLSNLVLHELDLFITELMEKKVKKGITPTLNNPAYTQLTKGLVKKRELLIQKKKQEGLKHLSVADKKEKRILIYQRLQIPRKVPNPKYSYFDYVRYADDWLIGVWGSHSYAKTLKARVGEFLLGIKLQLSERKTLITSSITGRAKFLGTYISTISAKHGLTRTVKKKNGLLKNGLLTKMPWGKIWMTAPIAKILKRFAEKHFLKFKENGRLRFLYPKHLIVLPIKELIIMYRSILKGYLNYFSFVDKRYKLGTLYWCLRESLLKIIGKKKQISRTSVIKKFGPNVVLPITRKDGKTVFLDFACPPLTKLPKPFLGYKGERDPLEIMDWKISTVDTMGQNCANCDGTNQIEMHHVKHIKTISPKLSQFDQALARINRKQVPLCRRCHLQVHSGSYQGRPLGHFYYIPFQGEAKWS
jgi:group II intron reverse transcriptase/maturase